MERIHDTHQHSPPVRLVQTWRSLLKDENAEVRDHANEMLINSFGDMKAILDYVNKHRIKV
tara:strand:+ start:445 stop:627 length:183 start_codon:yes stop_codon:yes gene_type:complete